MGVFGGVNQEGIWEEDSYTPHRFFSFFTDESLKGVLSKHFDIISFEQIDTGGKYYFQSVVMRKKRKKSEVAYVSPHGKRPKDKAPWSVKWSS